MEYSLDSILVSLYDVIVIAGVNGFLLALGLLYSVKIVKYCHPECLRYVILRNAKK